MKNKLRVLFAASVVAGTEAHPEKLADETLRLGVSFFAVGQ